MKIFLISILKPQSNQGCGLFLYLYFYPLSTVAYLVIKKEKHQSYKTGA